MNEKIVEVLDYEALGKITELIRQGQTVKVKILKDGEHQMLVHEEKHVFSFECSKCGNSEYNATSGILATLNGLTDPKKSPWTRKAVTPLLSFSH